MAHYLIVANQTIGGEQLTATLDELATAGSSTFRFLVPVTDTEGTQQWDYPPIDRLIPDAHQIARVLAEARLENELARLRQSGIEASGEVVDSQPVDRAQELLRRATSMASSSRPCRAGCPGGCSGTCRTASPAWPTYR